MRLSRRGLMTAAATLPIASARAQTPIIRVGVLNDMSGPYSANTGRIGALCAQQAVDEFASAHGLRVDVLSADHQNKADVASAIAGRWIDTDGVDVIVDVGTSSCALAVNSICRAKDRIMLNTGAASTDLTGKQCTPNTIHWVYDTYMLAKSTGGALVKAGGTSWFCITADYVFGHQLQRDLSEFVIKSGGTVVGSVQHPFPETTDFSAFLLQAQASGAKVLGLCNSGDDTVNCLKQAREFGLFDTMIPAAMLIQDHDVASVGLKDAQGLRLTSSYYWDLNDRTRAFNERMKAKSPDQPPNSLQAGDYSSVLHYLKAVADMGAAEAKRSGAAVVARMKAMPTDDDAFGPGRVREDGRKLHPSYLFEAKSPEESRSRWDILKVVATTPADEAFRPMIEGGCPLVKS